MKKTSLALVGLVLMGLVAGCSGKGVVVNEFRLLKDGESLSFKLPAGQYQVEMTASDDGAAIQWVGSDCVNSKQTNEFQTICTMHKDGQLIVSNPTGFGMGASTSITLKVTRIS